MATELAKAYVQIVPSAEGISGKIENIFNGSEAQNATHKSGTAIGKTLLKGAGVAMAAGATAVAGAVTAIGGTVKSSLSNFADYEQLAGGAKLMFGDAYDFIADKASNAFATVQMSANEYLTKANGYAVGLKEALGGDAQAAADLADKIITAQADIVSATGSDAEAVANAFAGVMKGNYSMLDNLNLGINATKEGMQQVINKMNEVNGTHYTIDNVADVQQALIDYVGYVEMAGYAQAEGATTIQGALATMKGAWSNFLTGMVDSEQNFDGLVNNLVDSIMGVTDLLVPRITDTVPRVVDGISQVITQLIGYLPGLMSQLLPTLIEGASGLVNSIVEMLPSMINALIECLPMFIDAVVQIVNGIIGALPDIVQMIVGALPTLIPALIDGMVQMAIALANALPQIIMAIIEALPSIIVSIVDALLNNLPTLLLGVGQLILGIVKALPQMLLGVFGAIGDLFGSITDHLSEWGENINKKVSEKFNAMKSSIEEHGGGIKGFLGATGDAIKEQWSKNFEALDKVTGGKLSEIKAKIQENGGGFKGFFKTVGDSIKGQWQKNFDAMDKVTGGKLSNIKDAMMSKLSGAKDNAVKVLGNIKEKFSSIFDNVKDKVFGVVDKIKGAFKFNISLPKIKLPHIKLTPDGWKFSDILTKGSIPKLKIEWYAKAMNEPYMFTRPTVVGNKGFGDAGNEIVYGRNALMRDIREASRNDSAIEEKLDRMIDLLGKLTEMSVTLDSQTLVGQLAPAMDSALGQRAINRARYV